MPKAPKNLRDFNSLQKVVETLRSPEGCPWDNEQTHLTLAPFTLEEAHEMIEAIDQGDDEALKEELGDVLFQVVLHATVAQQRHAFGLSDVIETLNEKMIRRHPHVFGDVKVASTEEVIANWSQIKAGEKLKAGGSAPIDAKVDAVF